MENELDRAFKPTVEWMRSKYEELNNRVFRGMLGGCRFGLFTSGNGSEGRTLGRFRIGRMVRIVIRTRQMCLQNVYGERRYIDSSNFESLCDPTIELNGNYTGTEKAFTDVLVHEMCHYYTYMRGYCPKQGHGVEFRNIASNVEYWSNGEFTVQRLASAETMEGLDLNDEMKTKSEKRESAKKSKLTAILRFMKDGRVQLTNTSTKSLMDRIISSHKDKDVVRVVVSNDPNLIEDIFSSGYKKAQRVWKYWYVEHRDFAKNIDNYEITEYVNNTMGENKKTVGQIIREVIEELMTDDMNGGDTIEMTPDMNLGLHSPLEQY